MTRRRERISPFVLLSAVIVLPALGDAAPAAEPGLPNPFFVFSNGLDGVQDPPTVLKDLGYAGVGVAGLDVIGAVKEYEKAGLKVFNTYVGCRLDKTPAYDPQFKKAVRELKGTGVLLWLTVLGGKYGQEDEKAVGIVREIADLAATSGLRVALYPHTGFYVATTADALRLTKKVDRKNLGATLNLCHELMTDQGAKLDETIREVAPYLFVVSINGGRQATRLQLGSLDPAAGPRRLRRLRFPPQSQGGRLSRSYRTPMLCGPGRQAGEPPPVDQNMAEI